MKNLPTPFLTLLLAATFACQPAPQAEAPAPAPVPEAPAAATEATTQLFRPPSLETDLPPRYARGDHSVRP